MAVFTQDHVAEALRRQLTQFKKKPNFRKLLTIFGDSAQKLSDVLAALYVVFELDTATGKNLDAIGSMLGLPRYGYNDDTYRLHLSVQALLLLAGRGTVSTVLRIVRALIPDLNRAIQYQEVYPMGYIITVDDLTQEEADVLMRFLEYARPTAYGYHLIGAVIDGFIYDTEDGDILNGFGFGSDTDPNIGGGLAYVF